MVINYLNKICKVKQIITFVISVRVPLILDFIILTKFSVA